ncbi:GIY-YIG nuclease family protein [Desulfotalea psychrophila]|uniref:UPF0213 protein DP2720 n=1 Tax=Desulfotalea psychrophila (strain LSv54 / DSM 12343) TaxID=177439 RepID=Y2720_DESPS|nr:GIY-YIG nuclease family protein [Desulfotalea psychrophila]Q6AJN1.1 RecName: Full=UPF0213 protein DP2720 [Desulfotalea psychrophila LSv54]CAG37449.1 hypothetical protein DP2720 [Desulfotalea psychrophila LSv54]
MNCIQRPETDRPAWFVYIVQCADGTLYTGITTNIARRITEHNSSAKGARYTRSRRPVMLVYRETCRDRSEASKREYAIKQLSPTRKRTLVKASEKGFSAIYFPSYSIKGQ